MCCLSAPFIFLSSIFQIIFHIASHLRRKLKADISTAFPSLSVEELSELVPNKEELNVVKIYAHKGDAVTLYMLHKNPVFFELEKCLYPTVYTLWHYPHVLPTFTTWPPVLQKLAGGADLMLPGVVVPLSGLPEVKKGDCCAVKVVSNRAPMAVGTATMSSAEMRSLGMKGRGVSVLHTYMDSLWAFGDKSGPPSIPDVDTEGVEAMYGEEEEDDEATEGGEEEPCPNSDGDKATDCLSLKAGILLHMSHELTPKNRHVCDIYTVIVSHKHSPVLTEQMDALLLQCFLQALKSKVKKSELPLLTSSFLRIHMFSCCPSGKQLDIKKSSYKKLSKFLQCMQQQHSLVRVEELSKGVESIVEVDWKNSELRSFRTPKDPGIEEASVEVGGAEGEKPYHPPEITTLYSVSSRLEPLFQDSICSRCLCELSTSYVIINPILCDCLLEKSEYQEVEALKWDDLFSRTLYKMQHCHQLVFPGQPPIVKKGHIEPIDISVASRGSNKKVTMIKNLEVYGLDPMAVSVALQHRVQASSALNPVPGSKDRVLVQIQGNQVQQVCKLLLDKYQIPCKYIQGLDNKVQKPGRKK
uniref:Eukaryotic translation initiation factor 2D n=1 Tax=Salmo trutta TaxID=8032 RepID=A0A674BN53_SALTR